MVCKGICEKYKIPKPPANNNGSYEMGNRRCTTCELYIKWDGIYCPCCKAQLRNKPHNSRSRKKLQEIAIVKRI